MDLRRLIAAQDRVQENERKRIARELHDDLQQTLGAIKFNAMAIGDRLLASPQAVPALLEEIDDLASGAIGSTRRIVNNLRPHMLEDLGLVPAVEALAGSSGNTPASPADWTRMPISTMSWRNVRISPPACTA